MTGERDDAATALIALLSALNALGYVFTTITPTTHARVLAREPGRIAQNLRDIFGWSLPFRRETIAPTLFDLLQRGRALERRGDLYASAYRVARFDEALFLHAAFPTTAANAIFFGPDSYRFARFLRQSLPGAKKTLMRVADIGAGAGIGAYAVARQRPGASLVLTDLNTDALRIAAVNMAAAGLRADLVETNALDGVDGAFDLIIANPPYMIDAARRLYRDGGAAYGAGVSLAWADQAMARLAPGGRFALYTGSAIVDGEDGLHEALSALATRRGCEIAYEEIDPDVWGDELSGPDYAAVERIAVVGAVMTREA